MKKSLFLLCLVLTFFQAHAQVIYGVNNYTQYHIGNLPIIISVPHGGLVSPASIPTRTCNNPTTVTDSRTIELARQIDTALFKLTGCHPHLIICNLRRTKVDCNRNLADGACNNSEAKTAWTEFQHFIDTAQSMAQNQYSNKVLYIDLHGHGKMPYRLELGYGLSAGSYNNTDSVLNTPPFLINSSIKNLVTSNVNGYTHAQLLRGPKALGTLLANAGFPSVPSQQSPNTGGFDYFNGGYNTFNHTCISPGNTVNGLQIECDSIVRSNYSNRKKFADSTAAILVNYLFIHQGLNLVNPLTSAAVNISASATTICSGQTVSFTATPTNGGNSLIYQWYQDGSPVGTNSPTFSTTTLANGASVYCTMTSNTDCVNPTTVTSATINITVTPLPQPNLVISNDTIYASNYTGGQYFFNWYFNGNLVSTTEFIILQASGLYELTININGCTTSSSISVVGTNDNIIESHIVIYPNPTNGFFTIEGKELNSGLCRISLRNVLGQVLIEKPIILSGRGFSTQLNIEGLPSGIYYMTVHSQYGNNTIPVIKQ